MAANGGSMKRLLALLALAALLTACGTTNPFQPTGRIEVTFNPANANPNTYLWGPDYKLLGKYDGDFSANVPAGSVRLSTTADGYDHYSHTVQLAAGQSLRVDAQLIESLRATFSTFSVTRYQTATITMSGLTVSNYTGTVTVRASCVEDGYPNLTTGLKGQVTVSAGVPASAYLQHSSGFPYFTNNTVRCGLYVQAPGRDEVSIERR